MAFISGKNLPFPVLNDKETVLLTAERPTCFRSLVVCNLSNNSDLIRISLKVVVTLGLILPNSSYYIRNLGIKKNESLNLIEYLKSEIWIYDGESLIISSGGYTETFNCTPNIYELNELLDDQ